MCWDPQFRAERWQSHSPHYQTVKIEIEESSMLYFGPIREGGVNLMEDLRHPSVNILI